MTPNLSAPPVSDLGRRAIQPRLATAGGSPIRLPGDPPSPASQTENGGKAIGAARRVATGRDWVAGRWDRRSATAELAVDSGSWRVTVLVQCYGARYARLALRAGPGLAELRMRRRGVMVVLAGAAPHQANCRGKG